MTKAAKNAEKSERELLGEVSEKLDKVVALLAVNGKTQDEQIAILRSFNHDWNFIGTLTGLSADAARMRFGTIQKEKPKKRGKNG